MDDQNSMTLAETKAKFTQVVRRAQRGKPVVVTRHGQRVAAVVPIEVFDRLLSARRLWQLIDQARELDALPPLKRRRRPH